MLFFVYVWKYIKPCHFIDEVWINITQSWVLHTGKWGTLIFVKSNNMCHFLPDTDTSDVRNLLNSSLSLNTYFRTILQASVTPDTWGKHWEKSRLTYEVQNTEDDFICVLSCLWILRFAYRNDIAFFPSIFSFSLVAASRGYLVAVCRLLTAVISLAVARGLQGTQASQ